VVFEPLIVAIGVVESVHGLAVVQLVGTAANASTALALDASV
jgi:hypothetical protein